MTAGPLWVLRRMELDARTIYDIACIREQRADATREDVDFKKIALRNWNAIAQVEALVEAAKRMLPSNACLSNRNVVDSTEVPLLATMGELRAVETALRPFAQEGE